MSHTLTVVLSTEDPQSLLDSIYNLDKDAVVAFKAEPERRDP